ncbi:MAG: 3-deoxy-D-manno-octulosonic acid transferase [Planctomycetales bacterium]|nr:3-deoxy-D-manno-octulosonic acid transferase [Planctomycetales bacterium]
MLVSWLLNFCLGVLLTLFSPWVLFRMIVQGKDRTGWRERLFGAVPPRESDRPCVWLHAVSVGEVLQLQPVLDGLAAEHPDCEFVISTTTVTGHEVARKKYPEYRVIFTPLDFSWAVNRALRRIAPAALVLVELELWPNLILSTARQGIPVLLINGRIGERSYRGYRRFRPVMRHILAKLSLCAVQNETYAERLRVLGADPAKVVVTGSIKFDRIDIRRDNPRTAELRRAFDLHPTETVFIAGSTQAPEEQFALDTYLALRPKHPNLRLVLVPRHKERFDEVARLVEETHGLPLVRRSGRMVDGGRWTVDESNAKSVSPSSILQPLPSVLSTEYSALSTQHSSLPTPILLLDTLGELAACWGLADIAFVGGSLTNRGGQNMIEPAGYGAAVMFGPNTWNFRDVVEMLLTGDAARIVRSAADLTEQVAWLLDHPAEAASLGQQAQQLVLAQQGATRRTVELIGRSLAVRKIAKPKAA